jgi:hypothetical protein
VVGEAVRGAISESESTEASSKLWLQALFEVELPSVGLLSGTAAPLHRLRFPMSFRTLSN